MARVLITSPDPSGNAGGVERFCGLLRDVLAAAAHDVQLVGPQCQPGRWAMRFALKPALMSASVPFRSAAWQPNLVITNGFLGGLRKRSIPTIHVFHGTMPGQAAATKTGQLFRQRCRDSMGGGLAEALAAHAAHVNAAVSESAACEARRFYRIRNVTVIENAVDTTIFRRRPRLEARRTLQLPSEAKLALFVGRAEPRKSPAAALEACRRAGFELLVAGREAIGDSRHLGILTPEQLAVVYSACDCVVFPTQYEACSYVVLEALAASVPVVTTPVGWVQTLLRHVPQYAQLTAPPDADRFASILGKLGEAATQAAVAQASAWVREHNSLETFSANWTALVDSTLRREEPRSRPVSRVAARLP